MVVLVGLDERRLLAAEQMLAFHFEFRRSDDDQQCLQPHPQLNSETEARTVTAAIRYFD